MYLTPLKVKAIALFIFPHSWTTKRFDAPMTLRILSNALSVRCFLHRKLEDFSSLIIALFSSNAPTTRYASSDSMIALPKLLLS